MVDLEESYLFHQEEEEEEVEHVDFAIEKKISHIINSHSNDVIGRRSDIDLEDVYSTFGMLGLPGMLPSR